MLLFRYVVQTDLRGVAVQGQQFKWHLWRDSSIIGRRLCFHCPPPHHRLGKDVRSNDISRWGQLERDPPDASKGKTLGGLREEWTLTPRRNMWFSLGAQFWPRVGYSLCASTATFDELEASLQRQYYQILPLGGGGG